MGRHSLVILSLALVCVCWLTPRVSGAEPITYEQVEPLLEAKCTLCHDSSDQGGGLDLSSYDAILRGGASGDVVSVGNPSGSKLYRSVARTERPFMPRGDGPLNAEELKLLERWIQDGLRRDAKSPPLKSTARVGLALELPRAQGPAPLPLALPLDALPPDRRADAAIALDTSPGAAFLALGAREQILCYGFPAPKANAKQGWGPKPFLGSLPFPGRVHAIRFSRQGSRLLALGGVAAREGRAQLYDVRSGRVLVQYSASKDVFLCGDLREDVAQFALGGPDRKVRVVSCQGEPERILEGHTDWITAISYSPDGVLLATADRAGGVFVWESRGAQRYLSLPAHPARVSALAWRPDSNLLLTACEDGWIRAFDAYEGKEIKKLRAHPQGVLDVAFASNGNVVTAGRDRRLKVWNLAGQLLAQSKVLADLPLQARFSSSSSLLVSGDWQGDLRLWRLIPNAVPKAKKGKAKAKKGKAKGKKGKAKAKKGKAKKGKAKKAKAKKGKPLPFRLVASGRVHATPQPLKGHLNRARRETLRAIPAARRASFALLRARGATALARWSQSLALSAHRQTVEAIQPSLAFQAQRRLVGALLLAQSAARLATPRTGRAATPGKGALRAGAGKGSGTAPLAVLSRLLAEAERESASRQEKWLLRARPALARARRERARLRVQAQRLAVSNARARKAHLQGAAAARAVQRSGLAFWEAEASYQEAWRETLATARAAAKADAVAARHASSVPATGARLRAISQVVTQARASTRNAAARLGSARLMCVEAAALAEDLRRASAGVLRVARVAGEPTQKDLARAKGFLGMARESLRAARQARAERAHARRALWSPAWARALWAARRALPRALAPARDALESRERARQARLLSDRLQARLEVLGQVRAKARHARGR